MTTPLQIALAVLLRDSKEQVKSFHDFGVTCSYDELLRFKKSVAFDANAKMDITGLKKNEKSLIQGVGDNFDQQIFSQNGKLQTHSMALLMTNSDHDDDRNQIDKQQLIPQLLKSEMTQQIPYIMDVDHYIGPKKPLPPVGSMTVQVPTLVTLSETAVILNRAKEKDLEFLKSILTGSPEYNSYNTKQAREEGYHYN